MIDVTSANTRLLSLLSNRLIVIIASRNVWKDHLVLDSNILKPCQLEIMPLEIK